MITMTRLRLINWHNFVNDTIDFKDLSYIIGLSGVGKTTIMDAIRYCLTTNKNFNSIGNRNSSRTLQGSVHGKKHTGGYSRMARTVAYIGCEFEGENKKSFVICSRIDSDSPKAETGSIKQDWYVSAEGVCLEDIPFIDRNTNTPSEKAAFKLSDNRLRACFNQKDARMRICLALGINKDTKITEKFLSVFHMGTSLDGLSNIRDFIYAYILPEPEVNANDLDRDRQELEKFQDVLNGSIQKQRCLEEIMDAFQSADNRKKDVDTNEGYILFAELMGMEEDIKLSEQQIDLNETKISKYNYDRGDLKKKKTAAQDSLDEIKRQADSLDEAKELEIYSRKLNDLKFRRGECLNSAQKFSTSLSRLNKFCNSLSEIGINLENAPFEKGKNEEYYLSAKNALCGYKDDLEEKQFSCRSDANDIVSRITETERRITVLKSGKFIYPHNDQAEKVKALINNGLNEAGMSGDAKIFCELLSMKDEKWQEAVEVCLGNRRFDIIVSHEHYKTAKAIMKKNHELCRGIALVDTPSLISDRKNISEPFENELAYTVVSENEYAQLYVNTLLYGIVCCENADELEEHKKSITADCIRHISYRTEFMRNAELYIGINARKKQLRKSEHELSALKSRQEKVKELLEKTNNIVSEYNRLINDELFTELCSFCGAEAECSGLSAEIGTLEIKIKELKNNPILRNIAVSIEELSADIKSYEKDIEELNKKIGAAEVHLKEHRRKLEALSNNIDETRNAFDGFCREHSQLEDDIRKKYADNSKTKAAKEIVKNQRDHHNQLKNALDRVIRDDLIPLQRQFNSIYSTDLAEGLDSREEYGEQYTLLTNIELEKNIKNLNEAMERCRERFHKDILFRLKDDIKKAQKQFRKLNMILSEFNYGEEKYHFDMDGTNDPELKIFYDVIMSENNAEPDLFNIDRIDPEMYEIQIQELMNKIMADIDAASKARLSGEKFDEKIWSKYADYRTYLDYDISVTNTITDESSLLSEVIGEGSGGETQAPFYVAICASLLQIYQQSNNSIRLVLLDEAFSHMTSDRIKPMIKMFKEMGLQVILISTAEKCTEIQPYCDIVHSIVRKGTRNAVLTITKTEARNVLCNT